MRLSFLLFSLIFLSSCGKTRKKVIAVPPGVSPITYLNKALKTIAREPETYYQLVRSKSIKDQTGKVSVIKLFRHYEDYFLIFNGDTIKNDLLSIESVDDYSDTVTNFKAPIRIYSESRLSSLLNQNDQTLRKYNWLFKTNLEEPENWKERYTDRFPQKIYTASIFPLQLDDDPETERILETVEGQSTRYFIFDKQGNKWITREVISFHDGSFRDIDTSLTGYFGLESHYWACGLSQSTMNYFRLTKDSIAYVFTGDKYFGLSLWWTINKKYDSGMSSDGEFELVNPDSIKATFTINATATDTSQREYKLITDEKYVVYYIKKGSEFATDSATSWFAPEDLDYFIPENYALYRLSQVKETGTSKQRKILKPYHYKKPKNIWEYR